MSIVERYSRDKEGKEELIKERDIKVKKVPI